MKRKLLIGLTGRTRKDWRDKLREIAKYHIKEIALFQEAFPVSERTGLLPALIASSVKSIPLVHLRDDSTRQDLITLQKHFKTSHFTIHEDHFEKNILSHWRGFYKNLYLEMNTNNCVSPIVKVEKIGGFCVDLAHYKREVAAQNKEYLYIIEHLKKSPSGCNHLSGYSYAKNKDLHHPTRLSDFNYLTTLPKNLFGKIMAIEVFNAITEQLTHQKKIKALLNNYLRGHIINN